MSIASHRRRFSAAARNAPPAKEPAEDPTLAFNAVVEQFALRKRQERDCAIAMVAFAQALAGTVMQPPVDGAAQQPGETAGSPEPASPAAGQPPTDRVEPLDPRKVYTWWEIMNHPSVKALPPWTASHVPHFYPDDDDDEDEA